MSGAGRLVCDVTDLLAFLRADRAPMGVARVQMALVEAGLAEPALLEAVAAEEDSRVFRSVPPAPLLALVAAARAGGGQQEPDWIATRRNAERALAASPPFAFRAGDALASLGATWWLPGHLARLRAVREGDGARLVFFFHDAIPLAVPEHCDRDLVRAFRGHAVALALHADLVVTNSRQSAREFEALRRETLPGVPVPVVPLGLDAPLPASGAAPRLAPWPRPYVLVVSTIESRKNHSFVLHGWLTLMRRHGERHVPDLLLVGRAGFGAEEALRLLDAAPELRRKVHWLEGVGDADLAQLYSGCQFAVFNSFHEGWGLPVTEALSHGKLVLTPDLPSLREAGGEAAEYFEPQNLPDFCERAWRLVRDEAFRRKGEAAIPARRKLRPWRDLAKALRDAALAGHATLPTPRDRAKLPLGHRVALGRGAEDGAGQAAAVMALDGEGWWPAEAWGVWARPEGGAARLRLRLGATLAEPGLLHLEVILPFGTPVRLRLRAFRPDAGEPTRWHIADPDPARAVTVVRLPVPPCPDEGELVVEIETPGNRGARGRDDARALGPGLIALMLCAAADRPARLAYIEAVSGWCDAAPA